MSEQSRSMPPPPQQAAPSSSSWAPPSASQRVDQPPPGGVDGSGGFSAPPPSQPSYIPPPPSSNIFTVPPPQRTPPAAPSAPLFDAPPPSAPLFDAPPPSSPIFNAPPPTSPSFPATPPASPNYAPPPSSFSVPVDDSVDEHTTLSARRSKSAAFWTLSMPNGAVELVTDRAIVVGREPQFMPALPQARLIPVPDPTRSVSKNHACFSLYGATLVVEDLGSTNGIIVTRPDGREHDIGVGGRTELEVGARVELGDTVIRIGRA